MAGAPVPGEAAVESPRSEGGLVLIRNVRLGMMEAEQRLDAVLDTGATYCVVPTRAARLLGCNPGNRLGSEAVQGVVGRAEMDVHNLEYLRAGTAQAYRVRFLVGDIGGPLSRFALLGLSFLRDFNVTLDFDRGRVLFRGRDEEALRYRLLR